MAAPVRPPNWFVRQRRAHPTWFLTALLCAAAVVVELEAASGLFGLMAHSSGPPGPTGPNLNPYDERILAVQGSVAYHGSATDYFPALQGVDLCAPGCPKLPFQNYALSPPQVGVLIFYNVTNTATATHNLTLPQVASTGGLEFDLQVMCCYTGLGASYSEWVMGPLSLSPSVTVGFEAYLWTTETIPSSPVGGYTLYANFTST